MKTVLPLRSQRLTFRRLTEADIEPMHSYQSREDYAVHAWRGPRNMDDVIGLAKDHAGEPRWSGDGDQIRLAVSPHDTDELAGEIVLTLADAEASQVEIGWALHPDHTGRGYAAEAARAAVEAAFQRLGAHRVFARLDSLNVASAKVCERIGMRHEATLRESHFQLGEWRDELIYAVLVSERDLDRPRSVTSAS